VNNADSNEKLDAETEPRKSDVLRAKDIIPSLKKPEDPAPVSQQAGQEAPTRPAELQKQPEQELGTESPPSTKEEQKKPVEDIPAEATTTEQPKNEIPRFNLAEKIMAEQRRITAVRRKGPGQEENQEHEQEAKPVSNAEEQVRPALSEEEQIIADIVARDIKRFCRGHISSINE
jgi:hypothetical protein